MKKVKESVHELYQEKVVLMKKLLIMRQYMQEAFERRNILRI
jgi:hypothetical protein